MIDGENICEYCRRVTRGGYVVKVTFKDRGVVMVYLCAGCKNSPRNCASIAAHSARDPKGPQYDEDQSQWG